MINASLNWASIIGVGLILWSFHMSFMILWQFIFVLNKRSEMNKKVFLQTVYLAYLFLFRSILIPVAGYILLIQGWRLDPILQFMTLMVISSYVFVSGKNVLFDFQRWQKRKLVTVSEEYSQKSK